MPTIKKQDIVKSLTATISKSNAVFLTDYRGLTHKQLEALRRALKKADAKLIVSKNTLMKIALKEGMTMDDATFEALSKCMTNETATLFTMGDAIAAIKALSAFAKETQLPKVKAGVFEGKLTTAADFAKLASLPGKQELLGMLVARLKGPIYGLHRSMQWNLQTLVVALNNVKGKKTN